MKSTVLKVGFSLVSLLGLTLQSKQAFSQIHFNPLVSSANEAASFRFVRNTEGPEGNRTRYTWTVTRRVLDGVSNCDVDTSKVASPKENASPKDDWVSHIGGDLFVTDELYGLHLTGAGSLTTGAGPGAEVRYRPIIVGAFTGFCGDEGIPGLHGVFSFLAIYAGTQVGEYRVEIGEIFGDNNLWTDMNTPHATYGSAFVGLSRRFGRIFFLEPDVKLVLPVVAHYWVGTNRFDFVPAVAHYGLADLFLSVGLKLGVGIN